MNKKLLTIIFLLITGMFMSCTKNFEEINTDIKHPADVPGNQLFTGALLNLADQVSNTNVNHNVWKLFAQYWTETTYTNEANYDVVNRRIPDNIFRTYYNDVLKNLEDAKAKISAEEAITDAQIANQKNRLAIIELLEVYSYERLVDMFGNIPYTEALDPNNAHPKYDDALTIYKDLIARAQAALGQLDPAGTSFDDGADLIYDGDVASWAKFGHSLLVKLGATLIDVDQTTAVDLVQNNYADAFAGNGDNAELAYLSSTPNTNPLYEDLVLSGRADFVAANTVVDIMNSLADPRIFDYFSNPVPIAFKVDVNEDGEITAYHDSVYTQSMFLYYDGDKDGNIDSLVYRAAPWTLAIADTAYDIYRYDGGPYGHSNSYGNYSHPGAKFYDPTFPAVLLSYDEITFYAAIVANKAGVTVDGKSAADLYADAIQASFDWWGAGDASAYIAANPLTDANLATQAWLAAYSRGLVGFTFWRLLDGPTFNVPPAPEQGVAADGFPRRITYPINEQTLNADNYNAAASAIGGDLLGTMLFWDVN